MPKIKLTDIIATMLTVFVLAFGMVSCMKRQADEMLATDRIELEQRYRDGIISYDEYSQVLAKWDKANWGQKP